MRATCLHTPKSAFRFADGRGFVEYCSVPQDLTQFVDEVVISRFSLDKGESATFRCLPRAAPWLRISLTDHVPQCESASLAWGAMRPTGKLILGGYFDFPFKVIATQSIGAINIRLHPSAAAALFPLGHNDLASRVWDLASLWPKSSAKLQRMLRDFDAPELLEAVLGMIRRAASGRGQMKPGVRRAVDVLSSHGGGGAVSALSTELGMSERNLYGLFQRSVCVPPKLFARISRFNRTLAELQPLHWRGERGIGAEEYFDESHRIREFAKFSGMTPRAYAQAAEDEGYRFSVLVK